MNDLISNYLERTVMVFLYKEDKVLLFKRLHTSFGDNQMAPPGGVVDKDESPEEAASRELREETGIIARPDDLSLIEETKVHEDGKTHYNYYFKATNFTGSPENLEPGRHDQLDWYDITNLPDNTMPLVSDIIDRTYRTT